MLPNFILSPYEADPSRPRKLVAAAGWRDASQSHLVNWQATFNNGQSRFAPVQSSSARNTITSIFHATALQWPEWLEKALIPTKIKAIAYA